MKPTYENFADQLTGRNRLSRKLDNHTYLLRIAENQIAVRLHNTNILTYYADGRIVFNSGGYRTVTTKDRINNFAPVIVSQKNGHWSITANITGIPWSERPWVSFAENMVLDTKTGTFEGAGAGRTEAETVLLSRRLKKFSKAYMDAFDAGKVPPPSGGDCWLCHFRAADVDVDPFPGHHHILLHLKENYFVPTLLARAMDRFPSSQMARWYVAARWAKENALSELDRQLVASSGGGFIRQQVEKSLYRYLKAEMGIAA